MNRLRRHAYRRWKVLAGAGITLVLASAILAWGPLEPAESKHGSFMRAFAAWEAGPMWDALCPSLALSLGSQEDLTLLTEMGREQSTRRGITSTARYMGEFHGAHIYAMDRSTVNGPDVTPYAITTGPGGCVASIN